MAGKQLLLFGFILLVYLVAGGLYAVLTPAWQTPDEPAHYNYARYLAEHAGFPELVVGCYDQPYLDQLTSRGFPTELSITGLCYEYHQPPLYYGLASLIYRAASGHLIGLRLLSVVFGAGVVTLAFFIGRTIFPQPLSVPFGAMAFVAFVPMHIAMLAAVNNDALAELIFAAILLLLVRRNESSEIAGLGRDLFLGVLLGLGFITKATVYIAVPLVAVALWLQFLGAPKKGWMQLVKQGIVIYGLAIGVALPWYIRNSMVYGGIDILGLARHDQIVVGQLRTTDFWAQVGGISYLISFIVTTFHSFWGQFGWMAVPMDGRTYRLLLLLTVLAIAGLVIFICTGWSNSPLRIRRNLLLMGTAVLLVIAAYIAYNLSFVQFQGRYLFPGLIPIGIFFSLGLSQILEPGWGKWLMGLLVAALGLEFMVFLGGGAADKWAILILGVGLGVTLARNMWPQYQDPLTIGMVICCYTGLGVLALLSPFWYILPYL